MYQNPTVARREAVIPGFPQLKLTVYGVDKARNLAEDMQQAFYVAKDGVAIARRELPADEREAVAAYLTANHPEHAMM